MSATNQTANLHLPVFVGDDKPAWLMIDADSGFGLVDVLTASTAAFEGFHLNVGR